MPCAVAVRLVAALADTSTMRARPLVVMGERIGFSSFERAPEYLAGRPRFAIRIRHQKRIGARQ